MTLTILFFAILAALIAHSLLQMCFVFSMEYRNQRKMKAYEDKMIAEMRESGKVPPEMMGMMGGGFPMAIPYGQIPGQMPASGTESTIDESAGSGGNYV